MSITTNRSRRTAATVSLLAALLLVLNALFVLAPASAAETVPGNPKCADYGLTEVAYFGSPHGDVGDELTQGDVTITITDAKDGGEVLAFDWTATSWIGVVIVKASNSANVYTYDPSVMSGSAVTVDNHGVSHISFCAGEAPPEDEEVTPQAPTFTDPTCDTPEAGLQLPDGPVGVTYAYTGDVEPGGTVTVTATADEGYTFPDGATTSWQHTYSEVPTDCGQEPVEVTPQAPTFTDPTCDDSQGGYQLPDGPEGVTYLVDGEPGPGSTVTITATADEGYAIPDGAVTSWQHTYAAAPTDCDEEPEEPEEPSEPQTDVESDVVVRPGVTFLDPTCEDEDRAEVVLTEVDGIDYTVEGDEAVGGTVTVAATTLDGFAFPEGTQTTWTHAFEAADGCVEVAPQVIEKPQPAPQPAPEVQSTQQLAATGLDSTELLLLALLLLGLGTVILVAPAPRRTR